MEKAYIFNPEILLKEKDEGKLLAVSMDESDHNYYEFSDMTKDCLKMFSEGSPSNDILKMIQEKSVQSTKQESVDFLEKFIKDLISLGILS
jgi:hypothetical protein